MKKRVLLMALCLLVLIPMLAVQSFAATVVDSGKCGDNLKWTLTSDGTLTISGTGEMYAWHYYHDIYHDKWCGCWEGGGEEQWHPWYEHRSSINALVIMPGVTSIGDYAFYECSELLGSLTIPDSVKTIGDYAFAYCDGFYGKLVIGNGVTSIGVSAFYDCDFTGNLIIPDSVTSIGYYAFGYCYGFTGSLTIGNSVTSIGDGAFYWCDGFTGDLTIPDSVTSIGDSAFSVCGFTGNLTIGDSVTSIGDSAFSVCGFTGNLTIGDSVTSIGEQAFSECGFTGNLTIPSKVKSIGYGAFSDCGFTGNLTIPDSVTSIGVSAFSGCGFTGILTLPEGLDRVSGGSFGSCDFSTVVIPESVVRIDAGAFSGMDKLTNVYYGGTKAQWQEIAIFSRNESLTNANIYYSAHPLKLVTQPKTSYTKQGANAKATVKATGDGLTYTWYYKNSGATKYSKSSITSATYSVQMSSSSKDRNVYCVITDQYGNSVQTNTVTLRMAATITAQPADVDVDSGSMAKVSVSAVGDGLTYAWYYKNTGDSKFILTKTFTGPTYSAAMNADRDGRQVYCVVTDKYGKTAQSETVTLYMKKKLAITTQPKTVYAKQGESAKVTVKATGNGLTYKWYYKNVDDSKFALTTTFTGDTYTAEMNAARNGRQIYCVVTDRYGDQVKSNTATLRMAATITQQPKSVTVANGATAKVSFTATGDGLTYTWYFKNKGETSFVKTTAFTGNTYSVEMNAARVGRQIYCVVKDKYGNSVQTNTVTLNMMSTAKITTQPKTVYAKQGATAKISLKATGDGLTYKWYYKNVGESKFTLTTTFTGDTYTAEMNAARNGRQVYCVVTDKYGNSVKSNTATLRMAATITQQPKSVTVAKGAAARVSFTAAGDGLTYTWYFKNKGETSFVKTTAFTGNTYSVEMNAARAGRQIYCVVTDKYGNTVKSNVVTLSMK